jgi:hypothetical protein
LISENYPYKTKHITTYAIARLPDTVIDLAIAISIPLPLLHVSPAMVLSVRRRVASYPLWRCRPPSPSSLLTLSCTTSPCTVLLGLRGCRVPPPSSAQSSSKSSSSPALSPQPNLAFWCKSFGSPHSGMKEAASREHWDNEDHERKATMEQLRCDCLISRPSPFLLPRYITTIEILHPYCAILTPFAILNPFMVHLFRLVFRRKRGYQFNYHSAQALPFLMTIHMWEMLLDY